jgi:hypothetical protein
LQSIAKQTGKVPPALAKEVAVPLAGVGLLDIYSKIARGRRYSANGPQPLSNTDINDWCQLMGTTLSNYEVEGIFRLDLITINNVYEKRK